MTPATTLPVEAREEMNLWRDMASAPENVLVMTKIHDAAGSRNEQPMMKRGNLWWINPGEPNEMYVYYRPTHWKHLSTELAP